MNEHRRSKATSKVESAQASDVPRSVEPAEDISVDDFEPAQVKTPGDEGPEFLWVLLGAEAASGLDALDIRAKAPDADPLIRVSAVRQIVQEVIREQRVRRTGQRRTALLAAHHRGGEEPNPAAVGEVPKPVEEATRRLAQRALARSGFERITR